MARASECYELGTRLCEIRMEILRAQDHLDAGRIRRAHEILTAAANLAQYMVEKHPVSSILSVHLRDAETRAAKGDRARASVAMDRAMNAANTAAVAAMVRCGAKARMRR